MFPPPGGRTRHALILLFILLLTGCSYSDKQDIHNLLDARDLAVSNHDINSYALLLIQDYQDQNQSEFEVVNNISKLFGQFDEIHMQSSNRVIRFLDDTHAQCEQSYLLRVKADNQWRKISQRERIELTHTVDGWKISGGL